MVQPICISSSPPVSPIKERSFQRPRPIVPKPTLYEDFAVGDFDTTSELVYSPPAKRRKTVSPEPRSRPTTRDTDFTLSSDWDVPPSSAPVRADSRRQQDVKFDDIDDITFSSSAPQAGPSRTKRNEAIHIGSSDTEDRTSPHKQIFSSLALEVLKLKSGEDTSVRSNITVQSKARVKSSSKARALVDDTIEFSSQPGASQAKRASKTKARNEYGPSQKEAKEATKELEKLQKQEAKLEREKEKQRAKDLAEVNKSKANKKETSKEMILELPSELQGLSIGNQVEEYMRQHEVRLTFGREEVTLDEADPWLHLGKVVKWKRKVEAVYNEDEGQWVPTERPRTETEPHVAILLNGLDFAQVAAGKGEQMTLAKMKENFDLHVTSLRSRFLDARLIYIIQGLYAWIKRNENAKNREYTAAVRAEVEDQPASQPKKRKTARIAQHLAAVTADAAEDIQLYLQVQHQPLVVHHTTSDASTASQILSFTQSLSARRYRTIELDHNLRSASFYMGSGQFKGGDDAQETFCRMLEEQQRVTPSIAQSIVSGYSSPRELVEAFRRKDNMMLENMRKSTNKDGGYSDKRIGPVISKRMYKVFLGRDPEATSGMS